MVLDPLRPERNEMEIVIIGLSIIAAFRIIFLDPEPLSVDVLLGPVWATIWALTLFTGPVLILVGVYWPGSLTGASLMQVGYAALGPVSLARGVALVGVGRVDDAGIMFFFGALCLLRGLRIGRRIGRFYPSGFVAGVRRWCGR